MEFFPNARRSGVVTSVRRRAIATAALVVFGTLPALSASPASASTPARIDFQDAVLPQGVSLPLPDGGAGFVLRSRPVTVDVGQFKRAISTAEAEGGDIEIALMPGTTLLVRPGRVVPQGLDEARRPALVYGSWSWSGSVRDASGGETGYVSLAVTEANGLNRPYDGVAGTFVSQGAEFQLAPVAGAVHAIMEVDSSVGGRGADHPDEPSSASAEIGGGDVEPVPPPATTAAAGVVIDVLALFTGAAKAEVADVAATINQEIGHANSANQRSQVDGVAFRLVGTREVNLTSSANIGDDLLDLRDPSDGVLDFVHYWRTQTGADLVVLFGTGYADRTVEEGGACGIAAQMNTVGSSFAPFAFGVVDIDRTKCRHHAAAHEMGHMLSLRHNWDEPKAGNGDGSPYPYNHGYASVEGDFKTVMSYDIAGCPGGSCTAIPNWSNPNVRYGNPARPTGVAEGNPRPAENYKALLNSSPYAANFRSAPGGSFTQAPYWVNWDVADDVNYRSDGLGGHVLDGFGGVHQTSSAPPPVCCPPYWNGWDIARGVDFVPSSASGVTLDGWGAIHEWGNPNVQTTGAPAWNGWDIARGIKLIRVEDPVVPGSQILGSYHYGGVTVDGFGALHTWGGASINRTGAPSWPGNDIARGVAVRSDGSGYTLDAWGGIHGWGGAPALAGQPYYPGLDWFRGITLGGGGYSGFTIDRYGGIYPLTTAG